MCTCRWRGKERQARPRAPKCDVVVRSSPPSDNSSAMHSFERIASVQSAKPIMFVEQISGRSALVQADAFSYSHLSFRFLLLKMSDDDSEVVYMRRSNANVLHYGSLEDQERRRMQGAASSGSFASDAIQAGISAGNINVSSGKNEVTVKERNGDILTICGFVASLMQLANPVHQEKREKLALFSF